MSAPVSLLIVEDDGNLRFLLETAARRLDVFSAVELAEDGAAALATLRQRDPQHLPGLVVTDLSMPRMTGMELLRAMKADPELRGIPVAVLTSSDLPNDHDDALRAGAFAFMAKPYGLDALAQTLGQIYALSPQAAGVDR